MFDGRLNTARVLILGCAFVAYSMAVAQPLSVAREERVEILLSSNSITAEIDSTIAGDTRKLDLREAFKFDKPDSFRGAEPSSDFSLRAPPPVVKSRKVMDMLRRQKEWVFLEPTEADFGLTANDFFNLQDDDPDKKETNDQSPLDRFYHRLHNNDASRTNGISQSSNDREDRTPLRVENLWNGSQGPDNSRFLKPFMSGPGAGYESYSTLQEGGGVYRLENPKTKEDDERIRVKEFRAEQFKRLLDSNFAIPSGETTVVGEGSWYQSSDPWRFPSSRPAAISGEIPPPSAKLPFSPLPTLSELHTTMPGAQDISTPAGLTSLAPALPAQEERRPEMPQPVFQMPKRRF